MSRVCQKCNAVLDDTAKFCYRCGTPIPISTDEKTGLLINDDEETGLLNNDDQETSLLTEETGELNPDDMSRYTPPYTPPQPSFTPNIPYAPQRLNEKDFYERFVSKKAKGWTTAIGVISLISGAISIPILFLGNLLSIIDIAFYILMGILILTTKKWGLPLAVTIYSGVFSVITLATSGTPSGIVALIVGIYATINLKKVNDAYKLYCRSGVLPQKPIE